MTNELECFGSGAYIEQFVDHGVVMIEGLPDMVQLKKSIAKPKLLILDDLMQEMKSDKKLVQLFTKGPHHWNLSVLHIVQNLFFDGLRTSRVNAQYLVLMKNPSDQLQASNLAIGIKNLDQIYCARAIVTAKAKVDGDSKYKMI